METTDALDVIQAEVCRRGLESITNEMAVTLMRTSGSPVVTDGKDFSTCLMDDQGDQIGFSTYVAFHVSTSFLGVAAVLAQHDPDDIWPGDGFLINDAHTAGSIHQGDCAIVMPYHHKGRLVAWGHVNEHVLDVGGSAVSGFAPEARDCYAEALRFPGIRVVRNGQLLPEWERFIATNVRVPVPVLNDLRSMIAAHNTGQRRLIDMISDMGYEDFRLYCEVNKDLSEKMVRERLTKLPDGEYHSRDWVEYDGHGSAELYELFLRLVVDGDRATLHFEGAPQVDAFINATQGVMLGQSMTTLLTQLIHDVPVNAGIWRPFEFDLGPQGTIVNAEPPAPTTQGHMETGMRVNKMVNDVVSQAASLSEDPVVRSRVAGQPANGAVSTSLSGIDRRTGQRVVFFPMSVPHCMGGGAQTTGDGLDTYGSQCTIGNGVPAVEIEESTSPMMVLWRSIAANSGGAGTHVGGRGVSMGIAVRGADTLSGTAFNSVAEVVPKGAAGGLPGAASDWYLIRNSNLDALLQEGAMPRRDRLEGDVVRMASKVGSLQVSEGDVFVFTVAGGGGFGDPLLREPRLVAEDLADGYVTHHAAHRLYGVSTDPDGTVDEGATRTLRHALRRTRLRDADPATEAAHAPHATVHLQEGTWVCGYCGAHLGPGTENYRDHAALTEEPVATFYEPLDMQVRPRPAGRPPVVLRQYACPGCASLLVAEVTLAGEPPARVPSLIP